MDDFAAWVARQISEDYRLVMMVGPRSNADVIVMREVKGGKEVKQHLQQQQR